MSYKCLIQKRVVKNYVVTLILFVLDMWFIVVVINVFPVPIPILQVPFDVTNWLSSRDRDYLFPSNKKHSDTNCLTTD